MVSECGEWIREGHGETLGGKGFHHYYFFFGEFHGMCIHGNLCQVHQMLY